jgi:ThiF family
MEVDGQPTGAAAVDDDVAGLGRAPVITGRGSLLTLLSRPSPFSNEEGALPVGEFEPNPNLSDTSAVGAAAPTRTTTSDLPPTALSTSKVLVVGAGGLGCEILKDLAMSGIPDVHVIDLDSIDVTNLNRQFLFRQADVGSSKARVAANFINDRCPWMRVTAHHGMIQDKDATFYRSFNVIISGLDNVEARRWLNATVCGLVEVDEDGDPDPSTIIPIVDGGAYQLHRNRRSWNVDAVSVFCEKSRPHSLLGACCHDIRKSSVSSQPSAITSSSLTMKAPRDFLVRPV